MSGDWGDDPADGIEADPFDIDEEEVAPEEREPGHLFGLDVAQLVEELAAPVLVKALHKAVRDVVQEAVNDEVADQLDPTVVEELRAQAATAARRSIRSALNRLDGNADDEEPALYFGSVDEFVRGFLLPNYRRRVDGGTKAAWARDWWRYPEAVSRLDAMWRAWEHLRLDPTTGMSVWYRDHAEHHMSILLSPSGPFAGVGAGKDRQHTNEQGQPLPYEAPPDGLFPDVRVS